MGRPEEWDAAPRVILDGTAFGASGEMGDGEAPPSVNVKKLCEH